MKKAVIVIVVLVLIGAGAYLIKKGYKSDSYSNSSGSSQTTTTAPGTETTPSTQSSQTPQATNTVTIQDMAFSPASITVKKGTTVTWTNKDSMPHTVTADDSAASGPKSGNLNNGDTYTFTFDTTGTFKYHCEVHPSMQATVVVTE